MRIAPQRITRPHLPRLPQQLEQLRANSTTACCDPASGCSVGIASNLSVNLTSSTNTSCNYRISIKFHRISMQKSRDDGWALAGLYNTNRTKQQLAAPGVRRNRNPQTYHRRAPQQRHRHLQSQSTPRNNLGNRNRQRPKRTVVTDRKTAAADLSFTPEIIVPEIF